MILHIAWQVDEQTHRIGPDVLWPVEPLESIKRVLNRDVLAELPFRLALRYLTIETLIGTINRRLELLAQADPEQAQRGSWSTGVVGTF